MLSMLSMLKYMLRLYFLIISNINFIDERRLLLEYRHINFTSLDCRYTNTGITV